MCRGRVWVTMLIISKFIPSCCVPTNQSKMPLAVVGSRDEISIGRKKVRVRQYPWGLVEVGRMAGLG